MSNHTSSSQPNLINRAYVLVPPPLKRKSSHLDRTLSPIDPSEPKTTFAPKKRQKLTVDIKLKNFDKSRYSSFNGNLYEPSRRLSPTVSDWGRQYGSLPVSPTVSELDALEPKSPLFTPALSSFDQDCFVDFSGQTSRVFSTERDDSLSSRGNIFLEPCEVIENANLRVPGESTPSLNDSDSSDEDDIPVRRIDNFAIFKLGSREMVYITELLPAEDSRCQFSASGIISSWRDEEEEDDDDDESDTNTSHDRETPVTTTAHTVDLTSILELNVHALSPSRMTLDSKIYIRTRYAWYILGNPHRQYRTFYSSYWLQHRILHAVVVASLTDARMTFPQFLQSVSQAEERYFPGHVLPCAQEIIGRELNADDVCSPDIQAYVVSAIPEVCFETFKISRVPLIRHFLSGVDYADKPIDSSTTRRRRPKVPSSQTTTKNIEKNVHAHRRSYGKTFLTPLVNQLAENCFEGSLEAADLEPEVQEGAYASSVPRFKHKQHPKDPKEVVVGRYLDRENDIYNDVKLDNVRYSAGDVVMVVQDEDEDSKKSKERSKNPYANKYWFCQIQYFFQQKTKIMFHAQWFNHGSETLLQELAHPGSLYYLGTCDDLPVGCIYKKANFTLLGSGQDPPQDLESFNDFHCGLQYDVETARFSDIPPNALVTPKSDSGRVCHACDVQNAQDSCSKTQSLDNGSVIHNGVTYHVREHVYVHPSSDKCHLLDIRQIIAFDTAKNTVQVRHLERMSERNARQSKKLASGFIDERELYVVDTKSVVPIHQLDGVCFVKHCHNPNEIEEWVHSGDDQFYLNEILLNGRLCPLPSERFAVCAECHRKNERAIERRLMYHKTSSKLVGMELFSGAGGLGLGMALSGAVSTKYAVEFSPSAAATFKHNHPNTEVFCQDTSVLLKRAVQRDAGVQLPTLYSNDGETVCPDLPRRDEKIDFIFGGPPCQSFSRANHNKTRDDRRSTLPCQMLSWVEYYRPRYFLLENVAGIQDHILYFHVEGDDGETNEVKVGQGMVKFIFRALITLGYQVHYRQLQALQYGVPQSRTRIIFWGALRGIPMPEFPLPTHGIEKVHSIKLPNGQKLPPISRWKGEGHYHTYAPHKPITVKDAIGDLPPFDWKNPETVIKSTKEEREETSNRIQRLGIPEFNARNDVDGGRNGPLNFESLPGYPNGTQYGSPPQNRYQKWLRRMPGAQDSKDKQTDMVTGHYTATFMPKHVEATVRIPLEPGAYHRMLPLQLVPRHVGPEAKSTNRILFGRMDGDKHFRCALTMLRPDLKNQWPLHPEQRRIISVRECARAQGFPDHYIFKSINTRPHGIIEDQIRQIGNAVAVPFALALGKELTKVLIQAWEEHQREGSPEL